MVVILWLNAYRMADRNSKDTALQRTYRAFEALIAGEDTAIDLVQAALLIASLEYPKLDIAHYIEQLDALGRRVRYLLALPEPAVSPELPTGIESLTVLEAMNKVLFDEEGFQGNQADYGNPDNSFLNKVLEERKGIPITLSLIYMEVGKRVGLQIDGIGLPFHFVTRCLLTEGPIYIDVFEGGQFLNERDCRSLIRRRAGGKIRLHAHWFEPVTRKQFLVRMLNNLKHIYMHSEEYERALSICDFTLLIVPQVPIEHRDRGIIHFQLKHYARALQDLTTYIELAPQSEDCTEILSYVKALRQIIAMMN